MNKQRVLVIGSINMDLLMSIPRFPQAGESVVGHTYNNLPGGKGSNQAVAAMLQGAEVTFVGKVGNDNNGEELRAILNKCGMNTEYLYKDDTKRSGLGVVMIDDTGYNRIVTFTESNTTITTDELDAAFMKSHDFMILQFEINYDAIFHACEKAKSIGLPYVVDAGPAIDFPLEKIVGMEILSPNETEAEVMCGVRIDSEDSAIKAAKILYSRAKPRYVIQKLGKDGAMLFDGVNSEFFPAVKVEKVVDTTAAGDVFTSALTVQYSLHGDIRKAIRYANVAGALTITKLGALPSIPTAEETIAYGKSIAYL